MSEMKLNLDFNKLYINVEYSNKDDIISSTSNKNICESNLKEFISNANKFNFYSAFDHKGAKYFLKSKGKALKEISIEDISITDDESSEKENKNTRKAKKEKERRHKHHKSSHQNTAVNSKKYIFSSNLESRHQSAKNASKKAFSLKNKNKEILNLVNKKAIKKNKSSKFYSQIELKMYKDKTINKLKPIKNLKCAKNSLKYYSCNNLVDSSFERTQSSKSNSTLLQIVNEISQSNINM